MPTRVLLEGPAIEPLLAQVRQEYGAGVRIVSADKVRSGGIGGFFAKQHYELSVEVPDPADDRTAVPPRATTSPRPPSGPEPAQTLEQLLERAESRDQIVADEPPVPEKQAGRDAGMEDTDDRFRAGAAFAEMLAGLDAGNHIATAGSPRPSPRPTPAVDQAQEKGETPSVRPFRPAQATGAPVNGGGTRPLPPVPSLAELMGGLGVADGDAFEAPRPVPPAPGRSAAAAYGLNPTTAAAAPHPASPTSGGGVPAVQQPSTAHPAVAPTAPPILRSVHNDPVVNNLIRVGMPEAMAAQITGGDTYAGVLTALASRPAAPGIPDAPGEILVLAGDLLHALRIGKHLLAEIGVDQSHLLLAGPSSAGTGLHSSRVMHDAKAAALRAEKLQSADSPWIVVLDAPVGSTDPLWVNELCDAIGATALWAVVDATRKTADTARHLRTLGEVEALVVHSVELTADPATVLGLDLPIFSLDGKPATPHAWAAMLCARIAADVTPMAAAPRRVARSARR